MVGENGPGGTLARAGLDLLDAWSDVISEGYVCEKIYAEPVRGLAYEY
jgi:hypothetical protein